ncbi:zinc-binding alcohol dehydrogenase domain-containing protein cipB [Aspergillus japonicus CBS 114.51]|uniref:Zinc-binding alcohol dehydrogenase domain-containing protein cipB n=2 Tax=Aspergillus TaxID=5052 RepID=A0A2V5INU8_ASPV1|nr:zinc-binding alcohol dehydrogenase domain-containing protein cipB [Aspergillus japonicus CBS 114.51]PYI21536.1 zinc-binding alcohol dehydrogenase domain-containing protein cipB [Aspergillus violaceofuscus CBS 115571]RAH75928.1 zinc-binding alcohol dehydrogenase domain-containing protein cipB [Aspergillus japonicus CBS 114.51]
MSTSSNSSKSPNSPNTAAWLLEPKAHPFQLQHAPLWEPAENEILVRNHAVAINPVDGSLQTKAWWPMEYPTILGQDVAGEVVQVGPQVTRFRPGDRVAGLAVGMATKRDQDHAFQAYTILQTNMASELPDTLSYEAAAVIPLGLSTAACGLFQDTHLALRVGSNAIQLAVAAGYEVVTTASPRNFDHATRLGAGRVFDYRSPTVVDELVAWLEGKTLVGAMDCIGFAATPMTVEVVRRSQGAKFVATVKGGFEAPDGVTVKSVFGTTLKDNAVGKAIYEDFLPRALKAGSFTPAPEPLVAGHGLHSIQAAVDRQAQGTSAQKIVVVL